LRVFIKFGHQKMRISGLCVSLLLLSACQSDKEKLLVGKWNATQLVECEEVVPINTSLINLEFKSNGQYIFNSTLNIHEEGKFRLSDAYLYTQDKIKRGAPEKAVFIKALSSDSLVLQMNYKGKDQWLTLMKEGVTVFEGNTVALKDIQEKKEELDSFYLQNQLITGNKDQLQDLAKMETGDVTTNAEAALATVSANKIIKDLTKPEDKKVEKTPEKSVDLREKANNEREALKRKEAAKETKIKEAERKRYEDYMDRERERKKEEAKRKAAKKK
jgi:hypothetical protein